MTSHFNQTIEGMKLKRKCPWNYEFQFHLSDSRNKVVQFYIMRPKEMDSNAFLNCFQNQQLFNLKKADIYFNSHLAKVKFSLQRNKKYIDLAREIWDNSKFPEFLIGDQPITVCQQCLDVIKAKTFFQDSFGQITKIISNSYFVQVTFKSIGKSNNYKTTIISAETLITFSKVLGGRTGVFYGSQQLSQFINKRKGLEYCPPDPINKEVNEEMNKLKRIYGNSVECYIYWHSADFSTIQKLQKQIKCGVKFTKSTSPEYEPEEQKEQNKSIYKSQEYPPRLMMTETILKNSQNIQHQQQIIHQQKQTLQQQQQQQEQLQKQQQQLKQKPQNSIELPKPQLSCKAQLDYDFYSKEGVRQKIYIPEIPQAIKNYYLKNQRVFEDECNCQHQEKSKLKEKFEQQVIPVFSKMMNEIFQEEKAEYLQGDKGFSESDNKFWKSRRQFSGRIIYSEPMARKQFKK